MMIGTKENIENINETIAETDTTDMIGEVIDRVKRNSEIVNVNGRNHYIEAL